MDAVVDAMRAEPWVDPAHIIVAERSRGGLTSVVHAAQHPGKVTGVINFSGGWGLLQDPEYFSAAGKTAHPPELRLSAENGTYVPLPDARKNFDEFRANGVKGISWRSVRSTGCRPKRSRQLRERGDPAGWLGG